MRRVAAAILPDALKQRHERWSTARYLDAVGPPTEEYVRRHGLTVRHGPFAGLHYPEGLDPRPSDLVAKLAGAYEEELAPVVAEWIGRGYKHVVDVGCAEGYYAVGFATTMPGTTVHAYDIDPLARERCVAMAALNGVQDHVAMGSACSPATLVGLPADGVALLADCEGYERTLLDPEAAPKLRGWTILVELHEFLDPEIGGTIVERFAPTHRVELIEQTEHDGSGIAELDFIDAPTRRLVLSERRPEQMSWAVLRPHGA